MKKKNSVFRRFFQYNIPEQRMSVLRTFLLIFLGSVVNLFALIAVPPVYSDNETGLQQAAQKTISGAITDQNGQPLAGVTVQVKGTTLGTLTDASGKYTLVNVPQDAILVVTFVGMTSQEIQVRNQSRVDVTMQESTVALDEIVVIGYGTQRRQEITGAVSSVKEEDFNRGVIISPEQLLQGKVSGVNVTSLSGEPGEAQSISIRGPGSVRTGSSPLYVIDGVPLDNTSTSPSVSSSIGTSGATNPLNFLNPADIESIDVLKDASSTAIYGSRGANGVIIITTKRGTQNEQINYNGSFSVSNISRKLDLLTTKEFIDYTTRFGDPTNVKTADTDWQDEVFRTAYTQNHNLSFSGGSERSRYFASLSLLDQEGVVQKSEMKRYTGKISADQKLLKDRLNVKLNLTASFTRYDSPPSGDGGRAEGELFANMLNANPTYPTHNPDGTIYNFPDGYSPLLLLDIFTDFRKTNRILGNLELSYEIIKGLQYKLNTSIDNSVSSRIGQSNPHNIANLEYQTGRLEEAMLENSSQVIENYFSYLLNVKDHKMNFLLGHSYQVFNYQTRNWSINNFGTTEIEAYHNPGIGTSLDLAQNRPSGSANKNELQSFFGRANYSYLNKYLLTLTGRMDGSSKFGGNNKYAFFPSFSAAWRISEENFLSGAKAVSNLTLRLGWGMTGNQEIPSKITKAQLTVSSGNGSGYSLNGTVVNPGFNFVRIPNEDIKWEVSRQTNIGVDFSFLNDRLYGTLDLFDKRSTDILWRTTTNIDPINPTSEFWNNYDMVIKNQGLELAMGFRQSSMNKNFNYDVGGNISLLRNEINDLPVSILATGVLNGPGLTAVDVNGYINGEPVGTFYLLEFLGLDEDGYNIFRDMNKDSNITDADRHPVGSALPKIYYNFYTNLDYKNFGLNLNFNGVSGNKIYNNTENAFLNYAIFLAGNNVTRNVVENTNENPLNSALPSTRFLHNGSFLRLNNATISYSPGKSLLFIRNLNFYITGQNLFMITKYPGYDPEVNTPKSEGGFASYGIDYTSYPKARTFIFGVSATF